MGPTFFTRIRLLFDPELSDNGPGHELSSEVIDILYALLQVLADDADAPRARFERHLQRCSVRSQSQMCEYQAGALLIDDRARSLMHSRFIACTPTERDTVLNSILTSYSHPDSQSPQLRKLRLTEYNINLILSTARVRRFRRFVVSDLLAFYYATARGWAIVDYTEYPGFVRTENLPCEVRSLRVEGQHIVLELSDACYERLRPETLSINASGQFVCQTKYGRQTATFTRGAHQTLGEMIEEKDGALALRVGESCFALKADDASS